MATKRQSPTSPWKQGSAFSFAKEDSESPPRTTVEPLDTGEIGNSREIEFPDPTCGFSSFDQFRRAHAEMSFEQAETYWCEFRNAVPPFTAPRSALAQQPSLSEPKTVFSMKNEMPSVISRNPQEDKVLISEVPYSTLKRLFISTAIATFSGLQTISPNFSGKGLSGALAMIGILCGFWAIIEFILLSDKLHNYVSENLKITDVKVKIIHYLWVISAPLIAYVLLLPWKVINEPNLVVDLVWNFFTTPLPPFKILLLLVGLALGYKLRNELEYPTHRHLIVISIITTIGAFKLGRDSVFFGYFYCLGVILHTNHKTS